jgi:hypothetical protein
MVMVSSRSGRFIPGYAPVITDVKVDKIINTRLPELDPRSSIVYHLDQLRFQGLGVTAILKTTMQQHSERMSGLREGWKEQFQSL